MRLKKYIFFVFIFILLISFPVSAEESEDTIENLFEEEKQEIISALPDEGKEILLDENGDISLESLGDIDASMVLGKMWEEFLSRIVSPVRALMSITSVMIICSIASSLKTDSLTDEKVDTFSLIADVSILLIILMPIMNLIESVINIISVAGQFVVIFIPVFAGIMLACGERAGAVGYQITALSAAELVTAIARKLIMPLLSVCMSFSISSVISNDTIRLGKISEGIKKISVIALTIIATVYCGIITMQDIAGNVADTVTTKTAKFIISSSVPAVGNAISGAMTSVQSSMIAIKNCVGIVGVVAPIIIILPTVLSVLAWQISLKAGSIVGELFSVKRIPEMLNAVSSVIGLLMSVLLLLGVILIITTTVMMTVGGGASLG